MFDAATGEHIYVSTACLHDLHELCRLVCKHCGVPCWCDHHYTDSKGTPVTEPLDNPAAPDADSDEPVVEFDPAADDGSDDDGPDTEDDDPVTPPAEDDGDAEDTEEDDSEAPAEAEPDDAPTAVETP